METPAKSTRALTEDDLRLIHTRTPNHLTLKDAHLTPRAGY